MCFDVKLTSIRCLCSNAPFMGAFPLQCHHCIIACNVSPSETPSTGHAPQTLSYLLTGFGSDSMWVSHHIFEICGLFLHNGLTVTITLLCILMHVWKLRWVMLGITMKYLCNCQNEGYRTVHLTTSAGVKLVNRYNRGCTVVDIGAVSDQWLDPLSHTTPSSSSNKSWSLGTPLADPRCWGQLQESGLSMADAHLTR